MNMDNPTEQPEQMEILSRNIEEFERKARRRALLSTAVPLFFGILLLGYTIWQIQISAKELADVQNKLSLTSQELTTADATLSDTQAQLNQANENLATLHEQLQNTTSELEQTKEELNKVKKELDETTQTLNSANVFLTNLFTVDIYIEKNELGSRYPAQAEVLFYIQDLQYRGVGWNYYGFSETDGFNSPNFVIYVLQYFGYISGEHGGNARPWQILKPVDRPAIGDIIYYEGGYSMFYFEQSGEPYVIGMTPLGIIAQRPDFAKVLGYLHVPYP
jgi:hypothetical protein